MRNCSKCGEKPLSEFYKDKNGKDGYRSVCKECDIKKAKKWNINNSVKHANHERKYRTNNKNIVKNNKNRYVENNPRSVKSSGLKYNYGITIEEYELMKLKQNNCCAICNKHEDLLSRELCVDHCHRSNKIRKLLCARCNSALGFIDDNVQNARNLLKYLEDHDV